jgi:hypothetical protein
MTAQARRPGIERIHFSVDGSIALMSTVPPSLIRHGDTASAGHPEHDGSAWLWRCVPIEGNIREIGRSGPPGGTAFGWQPIYPWSEDRARLAVEAADTVVVVVTSGVAS